MAAKGKKPSFWAAAVAQANLAEAGSWIGLKQLPVSTLGTVCDSDLSYGSVPAGQRTAEWLWEQTILRPALGYAVLERPHDPLKFRLLCQPGWGRASVVVHPDEAGKLVRAVAPYMRTQPVFAQRASTIYLPDGTTVPAGLLPFMQGQWTCPECTGGAPDAWYRQTYGYDARCMKPWSRDIQEIGSCYVGGPGNADSLCLPVDGGHGDGSAVQFRLEFWGDVAQAVEAYNADVRAGKPPRGYVKPPGSWMPLLAVGLGTGILATFLWNRR